MSKTGFFEPPNYNLEGRQQLWIDGIFTSHDTWCGCHHPLAHLLDSLLPPDHKDRKTTVDELINRSYKTKWHTSSGDAETATTTQEGDGEENIDQEELENVFGDAAIEDLLAAAANDERPR